MQVNSATTYLVYADLQMASEALLDQFQFTTSAGLIAALQFGNNRASKFTPTQATRFAAEWKVVAHEANTSSGFSGTLFECLVNDPTRGLVAGQLVLSFRSTEFIDDAARDNQATNAMELKTFGWAFGQIADMKSWFDRLNQTSAALAGKNFSVTGYSLGGHLATAFNRLLVDAGQGNRITATYTFNGAGVGEIASGTLTQAMATFVQARDQGSASFFATAETHDLYLQLRPILNGGASSTTAAMAGALSDILTRVTRQQNPPNSGTQAELMVLYNAIEQAKSVQEEAQRVQNGISSGASSSPPAAAVNEGEIKATTLDYQLAVLRAQATTRPYMSGNLDGLGLAYATNRAPQPLERASPIYDIYAAPFPSAVANSQHHYGQPLPTFIEDQPLWQGFFPGIVAWQSLRYGEAKLLGPGFAINDFGDTHSLVLLVDSLSVQDALAKLDPDVSSDALNLVLKAASNSTATTLPLTQGKAEGDVLENVLNSLSRVFMGPGAPTTIGKFDGGTWANPADRTIFHNNLNALQGTQAFKDAIGRVTLSPAAGRASLAADSRTDFVSFLSLLALSPFVLKAKTSTDANVVEAALAANWGSLHTEWIGDKNAVAVSQSAQNYTETWLNDRQAVLQWKMVNNLANLDGFLTSGLLGRPVPEKIVFEDKDSALRIQVGQTQASPSKQVIFLGSTSETFLGGIKEDHLYGGSGNDTLNGQGGADWLEGNAENDTLNGGSGADTLLGGAGTDTLDGGTDNDILLGGIGVDTYRFTGSWGADIIEDSGGQGSIVFEPLSSSPLSAVGATKVAPDAWQSADKNVYFTQVVLDATHTNLIVSFADRPDTITIRNWADGQLGLSLPGTITPPVTSTTTSGDFAKQLSGGSYSTDVHGYIAAGAAPNSDDVILGVSTDETLIGLGGNDGLAGGSGADVLEGGEGSDLLLGGFGADTINGGAGDDFIYGSAIGGIDTPTDPAFTPPVANGVERGRGFSWVAYRSPGERISASTFTMFDVQVTGANLSVVVPDGQGGQLLEATGNIIDGGSGADYIAAGTGADIVHGGTEDDDINGMDDGDVLFGEAGADIIYGDGTASPANFYNPSYTPAGEHGSDILSGGAGDDVLVGQGGADELYGGSENDWLWGDGPDLADTPIAVHGDDYLDGGDGVDLLVGGGRDDQLFGGVGNDRLWGDDTQDIVPLAYQGQDYLDGEAGDDQLIGGGNDDVLIGGAGNDIMLGDDVQGNVAASAHGDDFMDGGDGNDLMAGGGGNDEMEGGAGNDQLQGDDLGSNVDIAAHGMDLLDGGAGDDTLIGGGNADNLFGGDGNDFLRGDDLVAKVAASAHGADWLEGGAGEDTLKGDGGDDTLIGGTDTDNLAGGAGNDRYVFELGDSPLDALGLSESINDDEGTNTITFGAGITSDSLQFSDLGSGQYLAIDYSAGDHLLIRNGVGGSVQTFAFADGTTLSYNELIGRYAAAPVAGFGANGLYSVLGGRNDDSIASTAGFATLSGGRGNDTFAATGGGNGYLFNVGDGRDTVTDLGGINPSTGAPLPASRIVFGAGIAASDIKLTSDGTLVLQVGANAADAVRITGFNANNALATPSVDRFAFADGTVLTHAQLLARGFDFAGTASNDVLSGTNVQDRFDGGAGNDSLHGGAGGDSYAWGLGSGQDVIDDGDTSVGSIDVLQVGTGLATTDLVLNRVGNDLLVRVRNGTDQVNVVNHFTGAALEQMSFADGTVWNAASIAAHVTNELTQGPDNYTGTANDDFIAALGGNDVVNGLGGSDIIDGGPGNDTLNGGDGADILIGGAGVDVLNGNNGDDTLDGRSDAARDDMLGGAGADVYLFGRGSGTDWISDAGTDAGVDVLRLDAGIAPGDVKLTSGGGFGLLLSITGTADNVTFSPPGASSNRLERIEFADGTVWTESQWLQRSLDDSATQGNDTLFGFAGNDSINGLGGDDYLVGYGGNDTLDGGTGTDTLYGGDGNDTLIDGENMFGEAGSDTYVLRTWQGATITEVAEAGSVIDTLVLPVLASTVKVQLVYNSSTGSYDDLALSSMGSSGFVILPKFFFAQDSSFKVEQIRFSDGSVWSFADVMARAPANQTTEGNDFGVYGFRWNDVIDGKGGDDLINGQLGDDTISGGTGNDQLYGDVGSDVIRGDSGNDTLYGDLTQGTRAGDGNDDLDGGAGNDTLYGANGSDTLQGGVGNDLLDGGDGNDTFLIDRSSGFDTVVDSAGTDRIVLGATISAANVGLFRDGTDLFLTIDQSVSQTRIFGQFGGSSTTIERVEFADGSVWDAAAIAARTVVGTPNAMTGTIANDTFVVDDALDTITEGVTQGTDTVNSSVSYTLPANVENLTLTGFVNLRGFGNALNNVLTGNSGNNALDGGLGADTLIGGAGDDTYTIYSPEGDVVVESANGGIDTVISEWDYTLAANVENLTASNKYNRGISLTGNSLDNVITVSNGWSNNVLNGGAGADTMICLTPGATFHVDNPGDVVIGKDGNIVSNQNWTLPDGWGNLKLLAGASHGAGNSLANVLTGNGQNDLLEGFGGNDTFYAGIDSLAGYNSLGVDTLVGGAGNDTYSIDWTATSHDVVVEQVGEGDDTVVINGLVRAYDLAEFANVENLTLHGSSGAASLLGDAGANRLTGNDSANVLVGGDGNDILNDGGSNAFNADVDILEGGGGDDTLISGYGYDRLDGGAGNDVINIGSSSLGFVVFGAGYGADVVYASGSAFARKVLLKGDTQPGDLQLSRDGADLRMTLSSTADVLTWRAFFVDAVSTLPSGTLSAVEFADGFQLTAAQLVTRMLGGNSNVATAGDDVLLGGAATDTMSGLAGADLLAGGAGNDALAGGDGNDSLWAGDGTDDLSGGLGQDTLQGGAGSDTYRFAAGDGQDQVVDAGGISDSVLFAANVSASNVTVRRSGNDLVLAIGTGSDAVTIQGFFFGGDYPIESARFADGTVWDVPTLISMSTTLIGTAGDDTLVGDSGDERLFGLAGIDTLVGNGGIDLLDGGAGADTMAGGSGDDTYVVDNAGDIVQEALGDGLDTVQSSVTHTLASNVENIVLTGNGVVNATGNTLANVLTGNAANNTLNGATGADAMTGGAGNDTYVVDNAGDVVTETAGEGTDLVQSSVSYTLGANVDNLTLTGAATLTATGNSLDNVLTGNSANNTLTGSGGNDTLDGGLGNDTMAGGTGDDTYVVNATADIVSELANEGTDTIQTTVTLPTLAANVENITLLGTSALSATGNGLDNVLTGNSAANTLTGGAGNDTYVVGTGDTVVEAASAGTDTVFAGVTWTLATNVENLTLTGTAAINGTGNTQANVITGNSAANTLDGGTGADTLIGGAGNDTYVVDSALDVIVEAAGEGTDLVQSSATYTLGDTSIENLTLTGTSALNATGNGLDNVLTGNSANNTLTGAGGNDTLDGGTGNDTMLGGTGNDTYVVNATGDIVTEALNEGIDTIQTTVTLPTLAANVENLTLLGTSTLSATGNGLDNVLTGNSANNVLTGNAGNDTLDGGAGTDTMRGGLGDDLYIVERTADVVTENAGEGTDTIRTSVTLGTLVANVENLTLLGSGALNATGNALANVLLGNAGVNTLTGGAGNDSYDGAAGNDIYSDTDTTSNDTYRFGIGSGTDTLTDAGGTLDHVDLFAGITASQLQFAQVGNNLELKLAGNTADKLTINGWYASSANRIEEFRLADGGVVLASQAQSLVSAMAAFSPASGFETGGRMFIQPVRPGLELAVSSLL